MSVESSHFPAGTPGRRITSTELADHRQHLYDAKLALSSGDVHQAMALLNLALDDTNDWNET